MHCTPFGLNIKQLVLAEATPLLCQIGKVERHRGITIRTETITNENLEILFRFRFRNGKANKIPQIVFRICFHNDHVGHTQSTTASHTYEIKIQEVFFSFRFRNSTERKSLIMGFLFLFACNCFCEDGTETTKTQEPRIGIPIAWYKARIPGIPPKLQRGRVVTERGGTVLRTSQNFSALAWLFRIRNLIITISEKTSHNLWKPLKTSENLSENFWGRYPSVRYPIYLSTSRKSIREGAISLLGQRPESPKNVSCSRASGPTFGKEMAEKWIGLTGAIEKNGPKLGRMAKK